MSVPLLVPHDLMCARKGAGHSDAAKRISDQHRLHRSALNQAAIGGWFAVALSDGTSDGVLYDCKRDAVRHQHHNELRYAFICIGPADMTPCEAEEFLEINRLLSSKGIRMTDPDDVRGGRDVIMRSSTEDNRSLMRSIASGGRLAPSNLIPAAFQRPPH